VLALALASSATTASVTSTAKFSSTGSFVVDNEIIYYTGKTSDSFTGLLRGRSGTTAASHASGAAVRGPVLAAHHNGLASATVAIENKLGSGESIPTSGMYLKGTGMGTSAWGSLELPSSPTFTGTVTATNFVGNGAGITGITGATGGVSNTGSTTIAADSDVNGVGVIDLIVGGVTRMRAGAGNIDVFGTLTGKFYDKGGEVYNARAYGAVGDGVTDDTAALRSWIADACGPDGGAAYLPPGRYYVNPSSGTEVLLIEHPCTYWTVNARDSVLVVGPSVSSTTDIIRVKPSTPLGSGPYNDVDTRGYRFDGLGITASSGYDDTGQTARPGRHAINFDVSGSTAAVYQSSIEHAYITDLGGWGVYVTPNASPAGIYAFGYSRIKDSTIYNGLNMQGTVDSLLVQSVIMRGKNSVHIDQGVGSTQASIKDCNVTLANGISVTNAVQFKIEDNIIELRAASSVGTDGSVISVHGGTIQGGRISGNQINAITEAGAPALHGIYLQNAFGVEIDPNKYNVPASKSNVYFHGSDVTNVQLSLRQLPLPGSPAATTYTLNGAQAIFPAVAVGGGYLSSPLDGFLTYEGAKFGHGTHGHSDLYVNTATPGFGSIAAHTTAEYSITRTGLNVASDCKVMPYDSGAPYNGDPGAAFQWACRVRANAVILRLTNVTGSSATPNNITWVYYAELAD
jgi:hypothetical protein